MLALLEEWGIVLGGGQTHAVNYLSNLPNGFDIILGYAEAGKTFLGTSVAVRLLPG